MIVLRNVMFVYEDLLSNGLLSDGIRIQSAIEVWLTTEVTPLAPASIQLKILANKIVQELVAIVYHHCDHVQKCGLQKMNVMNVGLISLTQNAFKY